MNDSSGVIRFHDSFGPASVPKSSEGASSTELSITPGYETVTRPQIFKAKMAITEELTRWNKYEGDILNRSRALGLAAIQTVNRYAARPFIGGFTSTITEYGDDEELFSTSHDRPDGGTASSNASASGITLTEANLETAIIAMREQVSGTGKHLAIGYNDNLVLMVPNNLEKEAQIITGSTKRSGTPNNDLNWYLGKCAVFVNPFIGDDVYDMDGNQGSDTAWFLLARNVHRLMFVWAVHPSYKMWEDEDKNTLYTQVYLSCKATWADWRGTWGSKGDSASYSS
jgi:hypothetical protein